jgi:hypothetical protein
MRLLPSRSGFADAEVLETQNYGIRIPVSPAQGTPRSFHGRPTAVVRRRADHGCSGGGPTACHRGRVTPVKPRRYCEEIANVYRPKRVHDEKPR